MTSAALMQMSLAATWFWIRKGTFTVAQSMVAGSVKKWCGRSRHRTAAGSQLGEVDAIPQYATRYEHPCKNEIIMALSGEDLSRGSTLRSWTVFTAVIIAVLFTIGVKATPAQTYSEIYHFTAADGSLLTSTLLIDRGGKLYGTTESGQYGTCGWVGLVFQLKPVGSNWVLNPLHCFTGPLGGDHGA